MDSLYRERLGSVVKPLSRKQLAEHLVALGYPATVAGLAKALLRWEREERKPDVGEAIAIAQTAGLSVSWFVLGLDEGSPLHVAKPPPRAATVRPGGSPTDDGR